MNINNFLNFLSHNEPYDESYDDIILRLLKDLNDTEESLKIIIAKSQEVIDEALDLYGNVPMENIQKICQDASENIRKSEETISSIQKTREELNDYYAD